MNTDQKQLKDFTSYFSECAKHLTETDYYKRRGLTDETARKFNLGYDSKMRRLIIPTSIHSFAGRDVTGKSKLRYYKPTGQPTVSLNISKLQTADSPIFIVEGEIDAMSIEQDGFNAIGLGCTANVNKLIDELRKTKPAQPLIIALDEDEDTKAGEQATAELVEKLDQLSIAYIAPSIYPKGCKDANDALRNNNEEFIYNLQQAVERAKEYQPQFAIEMANMQKHYEEQQEEERAEYLSKFNDNQLLRFWQEIDEGAKTEHISTGFTRLDSALNGGLTEGLYILGAMTSIGKTTFVMQMLDYIAKQGRKVLVFSLEMGINELLARSLSRITYEATLKRKDNRPVKDIALTADAIRTKEKHDTFTDEQNEALKQATCSYLKYAKNILIVEGDDGKNIGDIVKEIHDFKRYTGEAPVVLIDYLQIIKNEDARITDKQFMDDIMLKLKHVSRDENIPIIGISSVSRKSYGGGISLQSLKESGSIEFCSDVVLGLQFAGLRTLKRTDNKKLTEDDINNYILGQRSQNIKFIELVILKNRNGVAGKRYLFKYRSDYFHFNEENEIVDQSEDAKAGEFV